MDNTIKFFVLSNLNKNNKSTLLKFFGMDLFLKLTGELLVDGLLMSDNNTIELTQMGIRELEILKDKEQINQGILPEIKSKISKIDKNFIFLPNQNELFF